MSSEINFISLTLSPPVTYNGVQVNSISYYPLYSQCRIGRGRTSVFTTDSFVDCLETINEFSTEFREIYPQFVTSEETPLTPVQLEEVEELSALYQEFLWAGLLPIAALIFALCLTLKILSRIFAI